MNNKTIVRAALIGVACFIAPVAWAETASQTFMMNAVQGNLAEVALGQLAQKNGSTDAIRKLAETQATDHGKANQNAMQVAQTLGVTVPTKPNSDQQAMYDKLAGETGATFDKDYIDGFIADHKKDIADYQKAASDNKDASGQYAAQTLPDLQKHMKMAQDIAGNGDSSASMAAGGAAMGGALQAGANSFTEGEAKARLERAGFPNVTALKKDDQGIWRGMANKDGAMMPVGLDFKGNVAATK